MVGERSALEDRELDEGMHKRMSNARHHSHRPQRAWPAEQHRRVAACLIHAVGDPRSQRPKKRRGTVLIFVVAILGVLFVSGIAFLTSINFEAKALQIEKHAGEDEAATSRIERIIEDALVDSFVSGPGQTGGRKPMSQFLPPLTTQNPEDVPRIRIQRPTWAELPGVDGLIGPLEPHSQGPVFTLLTDFDTLRRGKITRHDSSQAPGADRTIELGLFSQNVAVTRGIIDTSLQNDVQDFDGTHNKAPFERSLDDWDALAVDSDGDGIVDTRQYRLFREDLPADQFDTISRAVNDPANPRGRVYVAARVIPHGAMVNVNDAHPNLLRAALAHDWLNDSTEFLEAIEETNASDNRHGPYLPSAEEPMLRRRFQFPPAEMATSAIQGDPADLATTDPPGGGDFGTKMFPSSSFFPGRETVHKDGHQYWPFGYDAPNNDHEVWEGRMNPASAPETRDHRHLVTTVSHDDLITRGAAIDVYELVTNAGGPAQIAVDPATLQPIVTRGVDVVDLMRTVAQNSECANPNTFGFDGLPFEYLDYPHTVHSAQRILNNQPDPLDIAGPGLMSDVTQLYTDPGPAISWCECEMDSFQTGCRADPRKGRLRLSLPWLDRHTTNNPGNRSVEHPITEAMRNNLIYEAFEMLLLTARPNPTIRWGRFETLNIAGGGDAMRLWVRTPEQYKNISRTAAALTANMIDFMDADAVPTRIAVRNFELREADWDPAFHGGVAWSEAIGRPYGGSNDYVYGLERQPFITEITAYVQDDNGVADPNLSGYAVELFNPNNDPIVPGGSEYRLRFADGTEIPLTQNIAAKGYSVLYVDPENQFGLPDSLGFDNVATRGLSFSFLNGETIYLIRRRTYGVDTVDIVLDEFEVGGNVAEPLQTAEIWTLERRGVARTPDFPSRVGPWYAPFPAVPADAVHDATDPHTLGNDNAVLAIQDQYPIEIYTADTGRFDTAFPTTGAMLLLLRFANLAVTDWTAVVPGETFAFTTHLKEDFSDATGTEQYALDNGRMPVFDTLNLHHVPPAEGEGANPWQSTTVDDDWEAYRPGEPMHLPWGQLLFDYFTALPLDNDGPYRGAPATGNQVDPAAQARVDMGGLRVHGRININAAPWSVMQGLPLVPMDRFDYGATADHPVYTALKNALPHLDLNGAPVADDESGVLGRRRAMAITAYREVRNVMDVIGGGQTEDYGVGTTSRGWNDTDPELRRGTGFLSVGELANVRHSDAGDVFRLDNGIVTQNVLNVTANHPYLDAVAELVSLGDWVTVRSHVFTIYGTVRGETEPDPNGNPINVLDHLDEVNEQAIRFQKTIDRLPTFMGRSRPETIGNSVIARYSDVLND